jgi:hypothetical protein
MHKSYAAAISAAEDFAPEGQKFKEVGAPVALSTLNQAEGLSWAPGATGPPLAPGFAA